MPTPLIQRDLEQIADMLGKDAALLSGSTLLITGGSGFLGSYITAAIAHLNRAVLSAPCRVTVVDNALTSSSRNLVVEMDDPNFTYVTHDVRNPLPFTEPFDYLIHAAGVASPLYYKKYPLETIDGTIMGIKQLLEYARAHPPKGVLYFSSSEIYGDPDPNFIPTPEHYKGNVSCTGPRACYDESKRLGETYCVVYQQQFGVPVRVVRPFNVYGPGMRPNDFRVVPNFLVHALQGKPLPVHDKGNQTRSFCYVADAAAGFLLVLLRGKDGDAYNVGNASEEINMLALAQKVASLFGDDASAALVPYPEAYPTDEPRRRCPDLTKVHAELGYAARVPLEEGLRRSLQWFRETHGSTL